MIQADFVLAANREAIPKDKKWNVALRKAIALVFRNAVLKMCRDPRHPLRYEWPQYLPTGHIEGFWQPLYESIKTSLKDSAILESRKHKAMRQPRQLREVPSIFRHAGEPLFPDVPQHDVYLSAEYNRAHLPRLAELGLCDLSGHEMVDRLAEDLRSTGSLLRRTALDNAWHISFRDFVNQVSRNSTLRSRVCQLDIVPLSSNLWTCANNSIPVYFPLLVQKDAICLHIPENLGLRKLHPSACKDAHSKAFYSAQGVTNVSQQLIIQKVLAFQRQSDTGAFLRISDAVEHLEILFWFGEKPRDGLWASDQKYWRRTSKLYFPSDEPFHAQKLLGTRPWNDVPRLWHAGILILGLPGQVNSAVWAHMVAVAGKGCESSVLSESCLLSNIVTRLDARPLAQGGRPR